MKKLSVFSIFRSISGELGLVRQGTPTCFIRLAGCNLRCIYCDTQRAWRKETGKEMEVEEVLGEIERLECPHVLLTGGEPLLQQPNGLIKLCEELQDEGYLVSVETNGSVLPIPEFRDLVDSFVVDYKLTGSEERERMLPLDVYQVFPKDRSMFKFVCMDEEDFLEAVRVRDQMIIDTEHYNFIVSAVGGEMTPAELFELMIKHGEFEMDLNVQIHKYIFPQGEEGDEGGRP